MGMAHGWIGLQNDYLDGTVMSEAVLLSQNKKNCKGIMQVRSFCRTSGRFTDPNEMKIGMEAFLGITQRLNTLFHKKRHLVKNLFSNWSAKKDAPQTWPADLY